MSSRKRLSSNGLEAGLGNRSVARNLARLVGLRLRGIDASATHEARLQDAEDLAPIAYALAEGRVIFTQDDDFLRYLKLMNDCLDAEDMIGEVEYL